MQIEDVAWVRLASWWSAKEQRHLAIRHGVLREIVVDAECIAHLFAINGDANFHDLFCDCAAGEWCKVLQRCWIFSASDHDHGVAHRSLLLQHGDNGAHGGELLADRNVDADQALPLLVDDRVDRHGGLAGLAVADDQLALTAADWDECVNRLDASLHWRGDRLAADYAWRNALNGATLLCVDWALAIQWTTERINNAADQLWPNRNLNNTAGGLDGVTLFDALRITKEHGANSLFAKVECHASNAARELQKFRRECAGESVDLRNAVADLYYGANGARLGAAVKARDLRLQDANDLV